MAHSRHSPMYSGDLLAAVQYAREQRRHIFLREMALEIRRLVTHDRVGRGVRLVEGVVCEGVDIVVDRLRGASPLIPFAMQPLDAPAASPCRNAPRSF